MHSDWSITQNVNKRADWLTLFSLVRQVSFCFQLLLWSILLNVQKRIGEDNQILRTFKLLASHNRSDSQEVINLASNEAYSSATADSANTSFTGSNYASFT